MNRIQQYWTASSDPEMPVSREISEVEGGRFSVLPDAGQTLFAPIHYESNYAYPLIVWLHGPNDDERQLKRIMPFVSLRNYVGVSPRGTASAVECTGPESDQPGARDAQNTPAGQASRAGYRWQQTEEQIASAESRVLAAVAHAREEMNIA